MLRTIRYHPRALDPASQRYLRRAGADRETFHSGIVTPRQADIAEIGIVVAGAGLAFAAWLLLPTSWDWGPVWHAILFIGFVLLFVACGYRIFARQRRSYLGNFILVDPLRVWEVTPWVVTIHDIHGPTRAYCRHHVREGNYQSSDLQIEAATATTMITVHDWDSARRSTAFVNTVAKLLARNDPRLADVTTLGAVAAAIARKQKDVLDSLLKGAVRPDASAERGSRRRPPFVPVPRRLRAMPRGAGVPIQILLGALAVSVLCVVFVFPEVRTVLRDEQLYGRVEQSIKGFAEIDAYLSEFPHGRHAAEAKSLRDTRRFKLAREAAASDQSPVGLRNYLADRENTQHRTEAQSLIDRFYEIAIQRLELLPSAKGAHTELKAGLLAILRSLRRAPDSTVLVRFTGTHESNPTDDILRAEQVAVRATSEDLIDPGPAFAEQQVRSREKTILSRVAAAIGEIASSDVFALREAERGEVANIEIGYNVVPSGAIYVFTQKPVYSPGRQLIAIPMGRDNVTGLLRGYRIDWTVVLRGKTGRTKHQFRLSSEPAPRVKGRTTTGSVPASRGYTIMLGSAYDDLSKRLIEGFGLPATSTASR